MPGLPLQFWIERSLMAIANTLGKFTALDKDTWNCLNKRTTEVLADLDLREGLQAKLEIEWALGTFNQRLDYWKFPFRCLACH